MNKKILNAMTDIDDDFLLEAEDFKATKNKNKKTWITIAACLVVLVILSIPFSKFAVSNDKTIFGGSTDTAESELLDSISDSLSEESVNNVSDVADNDKGSYSSDENGTGSTSDNISAKYTVSINNVLYKVVCVEDETGLFVGAYNASTEELVFSKTYHKDTEFKFEEFVRLLEDSLAQE